MNIITTYLHYTVCVKLTTFKHHFLHTTKSKGLTKLRKCVHLHPHPLPSLSLCVHHPLPLLSSPLCVIVHCIQSLRGFITIEALKMVELI